MSGVFGQTEKSPETVEALRAKIAKLEAQIKSDIEIIRIYRTENRELKRKIRKLTSGVKPEAKRDVEKKESVKEKESTKTEIQNDSPSKNSSVWDNMFPF